MLVLRLAMVIVLVSASTVGAQTETYEGGDEVCHYTIRMNDDGTFEVVELTCEPVNWLDGNVTIMPDGTVTGGVMATVGPEENPDMFTCTLTDANAIFGCQAGDLDIEYQFDYLTLDQELAIQDTIFDYPVAVDLGLTDDGVTGDATVTTPIGDVTCDLNGVCTGDLETDIDLLDGTLTLGGNFHTGDDTYGTDLGYVFGDQQIDWTCEFQNGVLTTCSGTGAATIPVGEGELLTNVSLDVLNDIYGGNATLNGDWGTVNFQCTSTDSVFTDCQATITPVIEPLLGEIATDVTLDADFLNDTYHLDTNFTFDNATAELTCTLSGGDVTQSSIACGVDDFLGTNWDLTVDPLTGDVTTSVDTVIEHGIFTLTPTITWDEGSGLLVDTAGTVGPCELGLSLDDQGNCTARGTWILDCGMEIEGNVLDDGSVGCFLRWEPAAY